MLAYRHLGLCSSSLSNCLFCPVKSHRVTRIPRSPLVSVRVWESPDPNIAEASRRVLSTPFDVPAEIAAIVATESVLIAVVEGLRHDPLYTRWARFCGNAHPRPVASVQDLDRLLVVLPRPISPAEAWST